MVSLATKTLAVMTPLGRGKHGYDRKEIAKRIDKSRDGWRAEGNFNNISESIFWINSPFKREDYWFG